MPFKSEKQKKYLEMHEPKVAKEFAEKEKRMGGHKAYMKKMHAKMTKKQIEDMMHGYKRK